MRSTLYILLFICIINSINAQVSFNIRPIGGGTAISLSNGPVNANFGTTIQQFEIQFVGTPLGGITSYNVAYTPAGGSIFNLATLTTSGTWVPTSTAGIASLYGQQIDITDNTGNATISFSLQNPAAPAIVGAVPPAVVVVNQFPTTTAEQYVATLYPSLISTEFGLQLPTGSANTRYSGTNFTHIFLDQYGNSLAGAIPQGISNRQYVIHTVYLTNKSNRNQVQYSIEQTAGTFSSALVFNNSGQLQNFQLQNSNSSQAIVYEWAHSEFLLSTATNNIEFEVYRIISNNQTPFQMDKQLVTKKTIKMSQVFHASFDIGLLSTSLEDPNFELIANPADPTTQVVKRSRTGNRGIVTGMATFYTSPIVLIKHYLLGKKQPTYKLTGRNFLDDHKTFERIYPALGIALNETSFQNLFIGLNWEIARGGSIFVGRHYAQVNTFKEPEGFVFGETIFSQEQFNLALNAEDRWKGNWAVGANLDIRIISNLFSNSN